MLKLIIGKEKGFYERDELTRVKGGLEIMAEYRLETETRESKQWKKEESERSLGVIERIE